VRDYVVRMVSAIRHDKIAGTGPPGWAMGPFYTPQELAFTSDFEVKEWGAAGVRSTWDDHALSGPEYISVTCGQLTVVGGEAGGKNGTPVETMRVDIPAGSSVVLRPGFWRRFECTPDATGVSVRRPPTTVTASRDVGEVNGPDLDGRYQAFTEHWKHTDQIRQMLLYNFLMASTILVAAWGVLYSQSPKPSLLLTALAGLGFVLSLLWFVVARRATRYYDMYETNARRTESVLRDSQHWPFHARATFRDQVPRVFGQEIRAALITSGVPLLFVVLFVFLLVTAAFELCHAANALGRG